MREVYIESIGVAVPRYHAPQSEVAAFAARVAAAARDASDENGRAPRNGDGAPRREGLASPSAIGRIYRQSAIQSRHSVVDDFIRPPEEFSFFPPNWALTPVPSTAARMELYRTEAPPLALAAVDRCFSGAPHVAPADVTHLVVVTCTGFFAPGMDVVVAKRLGLRPSVERQVIGFMGCYGAFNGLRAARAACVADPSAVALVVCVELCSIHFQQEPTMNNVVANCLFADGAAAALVTATATGRARLAMVDSYTVLDDDSLDQMTWTITDTGFLMGLGSEVPTTLGRRADEFVDTLLGRNGVARGDVDFWAIHPGGRKVVEVLRDGLGLADEAVAASFGVLADYGNMSSPTVLFVLERCLAASRQGALGVAMAFGPGLTLESALLRAL